MRIVSRIRAARLEHILVAIGGHYRFVQDRGSSNCRAGVCLGCLLPRILRDGGRLLLDGRFPFGETFNSGKDIGFVILNGFLARRYDRGQFMDIPWVYGVVEVYLDNHYFMMMHPDREKHLAARQRTHRVINVAVEATEKTF